MAANTMSDGYSVQRTASLVCDMTLRSARVWTHGHRAHLRVARHSRRAGTRPHARRDRARTGPRRRSDIAHGSHARKRRSVGARRTAARALSQRHHLGEHRTTPNGAQQPRRFVVAHGIAIRNGAAQGCSARRRPSRPKRFALGHRWSDGVGGFSTRPFAHTRNGKIDRGIATVGVSCKSDAHDGGNRCAREASIAQRNSSIGLAGVGVLALLIAIWLARSIGRPVAELDHGSRGGRGSVRLHLKFAAMA